jgi:hypothetical protein
MRTKKKISFTIDAELFEAIEKAAETFNILKSQGKKKSLLILRFRHKRKLYRERISFAWRCVDCQLESFPRK